MSDVAATFRRTVDDPCFASIEVQAGGNLWIKQADGFVLCALETAPALAYAILEAVGAMRHD